MPTNVPDLICNHAASNNDADCAPTLCVLSGLMTPWNELAAPWIKNNDDGAITREPNGPASHRRTSNASLNGHISCPHTPGAAQSLPTTQSPQPATGSARSTPSSPAPSRMASSPKCPTGKSLR